MKKYSYAAPEIIAGKEYFGPLADIWSIGVILFALVCGFLPFEDANTANLYKKILSGKEEIIFFFYHLVDNNVFYSNSTSLCLNSIWLNYV